MPASLLVSQVEALEPLAADEAGYELDIDQPVEDMVAEAARALRSLREAPRAAGAAPGATDEEPGAPAARR
jgi:gluconokinase